MRVAVVILLCWAVVGCRENNEVAKPEPAPPAARNLVVITIDTLRADRVGAYGYAAARTPVMDRLARDGVRFTRAYATAPITLTSHASLMTGRYPAGHGARHNGMRLDLKTPTLADALSKAGFATAGFIGLSPRSAIRTDQGISDLWGSDAAKPQWAGGERETRTRGRE